MPFIEPRVPGTVYHKIRSLYRERRSPSPPADARRASASPKPATPSVEFRLAKAKLPRRKARSRRQLERLQSVQEQNKHLDLSLIIPQSLSDQKSTPPNKLFNRRQLVVTSNSTNRRKARPQTAVGIVSNTKIKRETPKANNSDSTNGIFKLTQGHICGDLDEADNERSDTETGGLHNAITKSTENGGNIHRISLRPKSAPFKVTYEEENYSSAESNISDDDCFDWETSDAALDVLEKKIRKFHDTQDNYSEKVPYKLREMRRFTVQVIACNSHILIKSLFLVMATSFPSL